jgi:uroporphyrinogen-III decarboxylase
MLGPAAFERLIAPHDTALVQTLRRYGAIAYYHNHGPIMRWLEPLAQLGIDALDPLEAPPWGDGDLRRAAEILGGRVCMVGNLDDMEVLDKLPREDVMRIARDRLREAGKEHFILGGTASGTYGERAARNFMALVEVAEEMA